MCLFKVGFGSLYLHVVAQRWDVWSFTKTLPFLGVVRYFFLLSLFSCLAAVSLSIMPSCVRSTLGARAPQWEGGCCSRDARPQRCEKKQTVMCGGGKATHPTPFPLRECEPLMLTRVPIVSLFLELGLFAPGVLPVCLMMTVNVIASNRHLRWWSPLCIGRGSADCRQSDCLPLIRRAIIALPSVSDVCWSCLPLSSRSVPTEERILQLLWSASDFKDGCPPASRT